MLNELNDVIVLDATLEGMSNNLKFWRIEAEIMTNEGTAFLTVYTLGEESNAGKRKLKRMLESLGFEGEIVYG